MAERYRRRVAGAAHLLKQDARMEGKALCMELSPLFHVI